MIHFLKRIHVYIFSCALSLIFSINSPLAKTTKSSLEDYNTISETTEAYDEDNTRDTWYKANDNTNEEFVGFSNKAIVAGIGINSINISEYIAKTVGAEIDVGFRWKVYEISEQTHIFNVNSAKFSFNTNNIHENIYISSRSLFMMLYEMKIGVSINRFSVYIKASLGGLCTDVQLLNSAKAQLSSTAGKDSSSTAGTDSSSTAGKDSSSTAGTDSSSSNEKVKKISSAKGFGVGVSFQVARHISVYAEYSFISADVKTEFKNIPNSEQTFSHKIHSISLGINVIFDIG